MSLRIIQDRLDSYECSSYKDEELALAEITQEIALAGLSRSDFFKKAAFQGGTCLRILYGLDRFSEDLDFMLKEENADFRWDKHLKGLGDEFDAYGIELTEVDRSEAKGAVQKAFLKNDSMGKVLHLSHKRPDGRPKSIRIKFELDTKPPAGSDVETKYLDFPYPFPVITQDSPSLFAGKSHALLCRKYTKGRDWYDFLWYVARKTPINFKFLSNAIEQVGPWKGERVDATKEWYLQKMQERVESIDWNDAKKDVMRFLKPRDLLPLELWSKEFFLDRLGKMQEYL